MLAKKSPAIKKAVVELKRLSQDEEAQILYDNRIKVIRDENSRTRTAINKREREIAQKMLKRGTPIEHIIEDTGLPVEEIEQLRAT